MYKLAFIEQLAEEYLEALAEEQLEKIAISDELAGRAYGTRMLKDFQSAGVPVGGIKGTMSLLNPSSYAKASDVGREQIRTGSGLRHAKRLRNVLKSGDMGRIGEYTTGLGQSVSQAGHGIQGGVTQAAGKLMKRFAK